MFGFNMKLDRGLLWELKMRAKRHQKMKDYYLSKAIEASMKGDKAEAKIYEEKAIASEKTRILTLRSLHRLERLEEVLKLAKELKRTARQIRRVQKIMKRQKVDEAIIKSMHALAEADEPEESIEEGIDLALHESHLEPSSAEKVIHEEFKAKLRSELEPADELEKIRAEIKRESEREDF